MEVSINVDVKLTEEDIEYVALTSVIEAVSEKFQIPKREIMSHARQQRLARARFAICYLGWLFTKRSFPSIGRFMGRDHTTILHGRNRAIELIRHDNRLGMHDLKGELNFGELVEASKFRAFEIELEKRNAIQDIKNDMQERLQQEAERGIDSIERTGFLRGDKVAFSAGDTE